MPRGTVPRGKRWWPLLLVVASSAAADETAVSRPSETAEGGSEAGAVRSAAGQVAAGEYMEAINSVATVIDRIERRSGRYDLALKDPLLVLGDALAGIGDDQGALGAYDRALHITRIGLGLHHPDQVEVVYRQARLLAKRGKRRDANDRHRYAYETLLRNYGPENPELLPGLFAIADWYLFTYNIFPARSLYEHAAKIAHDHLAADHPSRIRALRWIAATHRAERFSPLDVGEQRKRRGEYSNLAAIRLSKPPSVNTFSRGEQALIEVVNILRASEQATTEQVARAILELGDWFWLFQKKNRALTLYREVWRMLQPNTALRARTFDAPSALYLPLPRDPAPPAGATIRDARDGVIEFAIDVDANGMVSSVDLVRSQPQDMLDASVRRALRRARYRPAFDGKAPRSTADMRVIHNFTYYSSEPAGDSSEPAGDGMTGWRTPEPSRRSNLTAVSIADGQQ